MGSFLIMRLLFVAAVPIAVCISVKNIETNSVGESKDSSEDSSQDSSEEETSVKYSKVEEDDFDMLIAFDGSGDDSGDVTTHKHVGLEMHLCITERGTIDLFDINTQICCNGVFNMNSRSEECCYGDIIDTQENICCNGKEGECCGKLMHNEKKHICCNGNLLPRINGAECCKSVVFNGWEQICCDGNVYERNQGYSCCGSEVLNSSTHFCHKETIHKDQVLGMGGKGIHSTERNNASTVTTDSYQQSLFRGRSHSSWTISFGCLTCVILFTCCVIYLYYKTKETRTTAQSPLINRSLSRLRLTLRNARQSLCTETCFLNNDMVQNTQTCTIEGTEALPRAVVVDIHGEHGRSRVDLEQGEPSVHFDNDVASMPYMSRSKNLLTINEMKNSCIQTYPEKTCNLRTFNGKPFEHKIILGTSRATTEMPNSDVRMILPQIFVERKHVEVNCTSCDTISQLNKKLALQEHERIASPVVEYALNGFCELPEHAAVILPFVGSAADIKVRKCQSDQGMGSSVTSINVPMKDISSQDLETFYTVEDSTIRIYTKSFGAFYCTTCRHRPLSLRCLLFGSYERFTNPLRHVVTVMIYVGGDIMVLQDYKKTLIEKESSEGRELMQERTLNLPSDLTEDDFIHTSVTPTDSHYGQWIQKPSTGESSPVYEEKKIITLRSIVEKCQKCQYCHLREDRIPYRIELCLTNAESVIPNYSFEGDFSIDIIGNVDCVKTPNPFRLKLRNFP